MLGKPDRVGGWQLRLWWKPFVTLIWAGGALIAFGGALSLLGRVWRVADGATTGLASGALRMSRAVRFAPLAVLLLLLVAGWFGALRRPPTRTSRRSWTASRCRHSRCRQPSRRSRALSSADLATGQPHLLNIFASWCVPCIAEAAGAAAAEEHAASRSTASRSATGREDVAGFLARNGDPYERIGSDAQSRVQIALGSSGVPESFVVDGQRRHPLPAYRPD